MKHKRSRQHNRAEDIFYKSMKLVKTQTLPQLTELGNVLRKWAQYSEYPEAYTSQRNYDYYNHLQESYVSKEKLLGDLEYLSDRFQCPERLNAMFCIVQHLISHLLKESQNY